MAYSPCEGNLTSDLFFDFYMSNKVALKLGSEDRGRLLKIILRGENWRERERVQTLIRLGDGLSLVKAVGRVEVHVRPAGFARVDWLARNYESVIDRPRTGSPQKICPEQLSKVLNAVRSEPLNAKALLAKHVEDGGALVHLDTLKGVLTAAGFVWKRTRHSLTKKERG